MAGGVRTRQVIVAVVIFTSRGIVEAQTPLATDLGSRVDAIAKEILSRPVAGISVAVARDGLVVFTRGYGMANLEHSVAVTPETVFHIASISKNILAAVLLRLVDEGKLSLDDDVTKYVPEAPTQGRKVTVRQLLNHTSGIHSFTSLPKAELNERLDLTHDQVLALVKDKPFDFEPGTSWRYNNSAFYIAGMVAERVTKKDYAEYVREEVFKPLGMTTAQMCDTRMVVPHLASGYERDHGSLVNASFMSWKIPFAAGAICATATDLLKWEAALDDGRLLSAKSLALMRTPTTLSDGTVIDYGLGTRLGVLHGHRVVGHGGGGGGFGTALQAFPDDHLTIAVLTNGSGSTNSFALASSIARMILGLPEKETRRDLPVPKEELAALSGTFDSDEGTFEVFARDGKLLCRNLPAGPEGVLKRQAKNVYAVSETDDGSFVMRDGRAEWVIEHVNGLMMDAARRVP